MFSQNENKSLTVRSHVLSICDLKQYGELPTARAGAKLVSLENCCYMFGGCDSGQIFGDLFKLSVNQMQWERLRATGDVPEPRFGHSMHTVGQSKIVLYGGFMLQDGEKACSWQCPWGSWVYSGRFCNEVYLLDVTSMIWTRMIFEKDCSDEIPSPTAFHASCINGANQLVVHGGYYNQLNDTCDSGCLHVLDMETCKWTKQNICFPSGKNGSTKRAGHALCYRDNKYYMFGDSEMVETGIVEIDGFSWECHTRESVSPAVVPNGRRFHSFELCSPTSIYCFGGETLTRGVTDMYVYNVDSGEWSRPLYEGSLSSRGQGACVIGGDKLLIFGGLVSACNFSKTLFFLNALEIKATGTGVSNNQYKVVIVGDSGVGKSCLLTRFVSDIYTDFHLSTIGIDYKTITTMVKGRLVKLQLWDTAGQERFSVVTGNYYRNAHAFVIVYDATDRTSFNHIEGWIEQIKQNHDFGKDTVKLLCANKSDMHDNIAVSAAEGKSKADSIGALFVSTSAKTSLNVDSAFLSLAHALVDVANRSVSKPATAASPTTATPAITLNRPTNLVNTRNVLSNKSNSCCQ